MPRPATARRDATKTRLGLDALEAREVPATLRADLFNAPALRTNTLAISQANTLAVTSASSSLASSASIRAAAAAFLPQQVQARVIGDTLYITGTSRADHVKVTVSNGSVYAHADDRRLEFGDHTTSSVRRVQFDGGAGNDTFENLTDIPSTAFGGAGNDTLIGGGGADALYGQGDDDKLYGRNGADYLSGGAGYDILDAGGNPGDYAATGEATGGFVGYAGNIAVHRQGVGQVATWNGVLDLNRTWADARAGVIDQLKAYLGRGGMAGGQTLYNLGVYLAGAGETAVRANGDGTVDLRLTLRNNWVSAKSTTPTILGSWADPKFSINFDMALTVRLYTAGGLRAGGVSVQISNSRLDSQNWSGDVVKFGGAALKLFTGIDVKGALENRMNNLGDNAAVRKLMQNRLDGMKAPLAKVNAALPADVNLTYDAAAGRVVLVV